MKKIILPNGLTLIIDRIPSKSVSIEISVKTGSNNETKNIYGISHFMEHMLFEGTKKRPSSIEISNEIERLGGELNAYTSNERTSFYIKVQKNHFNIALDILSDIVQNPLFDLRSIEKERKVILKEINMVNDQPRFYQWVLFNKTLFKKHPAKNPVYGSVEDVKRITKKDLIDYYNKYYVPNNMVISVVGAVKKIENKFKDFKQKKLPATKQIIEPKQLKITKNIEKRKINNSYVVMGYKTVQRTHKDSYALDLIKALLGRGQSGRIVEEIRNKRGLAYEVNVHHEPLLSYGFFAVYLNTSKESIDKAKNIILNQLKLKNLSSEEINDAKGFLEGQYILEKEDTKEQADLLNFWELAKDVSLAKNYINKIKKINKKEILKVARRYFTKNYSMAVIMQS